MAKPKGQRVEWLMRAERDSVHRDIGKTLANSPDEISEPDALKFDVATSDGKWNLWSCGDRDFAASKALALDFLSQGKRVHLYKKVEDAQPFLFEDSEIKQALESIGASVTQTTKPKKTKALKDAQKRLKELKEKRKFQDVH